MKKKFLKILLLTAGLFSFTALTTVSCIDAGQIRNKYQYIKSFNHPNFLTTDDFSFNNYKYVSNDTDSLNFSPIISFEYKDKVTYDFVNNNVAIPTKKIRRLNLANFILIMLKDGSSKVYNNDNYDLSLTPPDDVSGYKNPILKVKSNDDFSINNPQFEKDLNNSNFVEINFKKVHYVNYMAKETPYILSANDFLLTISKKENKVKYNEIKKLYDIDLSVNSRGALLIKNEGNDLSSFFNEELSKNMIFNPTSTEYLKSLNETIDQYRPKLNKAIFLNNYILNSNDIEKQKYIKNTYGADSRFVNDPNTITEIILNFNSVPIDIETYRLQTFKAYRQNLISESDYSIFNSAQQKDILNFSSTYGLTYQLPGSTLISNINSLYNTDFKKDKSFDFNDAFSTLIYGSKISQLDNQKSKQFFAENKDSYLFRLYLSSFINLETLANSLGFKSYWNNLALPQIPLSGIDNKFNNYNSLFDAKIWVTQSTIPNYNFTNSTSTNAFLENEKSFSIKNILDYKQRLKSKNYDFIKANFKKILDDFYSQHQDLKNQKLKFSIPLFSPLTDISIKNATQIQELINSLDDRLDASVIIEDNKYNETTNSFVKYVKLTYQNASLTSYANIIFDNIDFIYSLVFTSNKNLNLLYELRDLIIDKKTKSEFIALILNSPEFKNAVKTKFLNYLNTKTNFEQISLINQINTIYPLPISLNLISYSNSLSRVIVQNNMIKPLNDLGFNQFQDIKVF